jgi:hypothetical protein
MLLKMSCAHHAQGNHSSSFFIFPWIYDLISLICRCKVRFHISCMNLPYESEESIPADILCKGCTVALRGKETVIRLPRSVVQRELLGGGAEAKGDSDYDEDPGDEDDFMEELEDGSGEDDFVGDDGEEVPKGGKRKQRSPAVARNVKPKAPPAPKVSKKNDASRKKLEALMRQARKRRK